MYYKNIQDFNSLTLANFLVRRSVLENNIIKDVERLQLLLYLCQGWSLALNSKPIMADDIYVGVRGPVIKKIRSLALSNNDLATTLLSSFKEEFISSYFEKYFLKNIFDYYSKYSFLMLYDITSCFGSPWQQTVMKYGNKINTDDLNCVIPRRIIKDYFNKMICNNQELCDKITRFQDMKERKLFLEL